MFDRLIVPQLSIEKWLCLLTTLLYQYASLPAMYFKHIG